MHFEPLLLYLHQLTSHPAAAAKKKKRLLECSEVMYYVVAFCQFSEKFFYLFFRIKALKLL